MHSASEGTATEATAPAAETTTTETTVPAAAETTSAMTTPAATTTAATSGENGWSDRHGRGEDRRDEAGDKPVFHRNILHLAAIRRARTIR
jgi:hypothetical protein